MEEAKKSQDEDDKIFEKAEKVASVEKLDRRTVLLYKEIFSTVDLTGTNRIGREEIRFGLKVAGIELNDRAFLEIWRRVDKDGSNAIDFSEFLEFMFDLRAQLLDPNSTLKKSRRKFDLGKPASADDTNIDDSLRLLNEDTPGTGIQMERSVQSLEEQSVQSLNLTDMEGSMEEFPYKPDTRANLDKIKAEKPAALPPSSVTSTGSSVAVIGTIKSNVMPPIIESPQQDIDQVVDSAIKTKPVTSASNPFITTPSSSATAKNILDYNSGATNKIKTYNGEYYQIQVIHDTNASDDADVISHLMTQPQGNNKYGMGIPMKVIHAMQSMQQHGFLNATSSPNIQQLQQLPFSPMVNYNNPAVNYGPTSFIPSKVKMNEMKNKTPKGNDVKLTPASNSGASPKKPCKSLVVSI